MAAGTELTRSDTDKLEQCAVVILQSTNAIAWKLIDIGRELKAAREIFGPRNAEFIEWAMHRCKICRTRCYECIQAFDAYGLSRSLDTFTVEALTMLSRESVPEEARQESIEMCEAGEPVTAKVAKALVEKHQPRKEPQDERSVPLVQGSDEEPAGDDVDSGLEPDGTDDGSDEPDEPVKPRAPVAKAGPVQPNNAGFYKLRIDEALADALAGIEKHDEIVRICVAGHLRDYADKIQGDD